MFSRIRVHIDDLFLLTDAKNMSSSRKLKFTTLCTTRSSAKTRSQISYKSAALPNCGSNRFKHHDVSPAQINEVSL